MPELPEVETVRRGLGPRLSGARLLGIEARATRLREDVPSDLETRLEGCTLLALTRRAKYLLFDFGPAIMLVHLGMSGSLRWMQAAETPRKHDHVIFTWQLATGEEVATAFHDPRRFGRIALLSAGEATRHPLLAGLGPEPLDAAFTPAMLHEALSRTRAPLKAALLNQRVVAGLGNIYVAEALFHAQLHPELPAHHASPEEAARLASAIRHVLESALASGGSTLRDYVNAAGEGGYFQHQFQVYGKEGAPCPACATPIMRLVQSGRSSFYCASCQPLVPSAKKRRA